MEATLKHDRRKEKRSRLRRGHSVLLQIPGHIVYPLLIGAFLLIATADYFSPRSVWFGPAYLLVLSIAAWSISFYVAAALGMLIISVSLMINDPTLYPYGPESTFVNLVLRFSAVLIVIGLLVMARRSLEREWRLARTDLLTGAMNRQAFFETVESAHTLDGWSILLFADLDGLKKINDENGHEQGDQELAAFAKRMKHAIRKDDVFARIGGDEFAAFMKVKDEEAGQSVAERLHRTINISPTNTDLSLRCSMGTLIIPPGIRNIDAELRAADQLMYEAKMSRTGFFAATAIRRGSALELSRHLPPCLAADRDTILRSSSLREARLIDAGKNRTESLPQSSVMAVG